MSYCIKKYTSFSQFFFCNNKYNFTYILLNNIIKTIHEQLY